MTDKTRLILTVLTLGIGFAMTACTGDSLTGIPESEDLERGLVVVPVDSFEHRLDSGDGAREAPEGLEIR